MAFERVTQGISSLFGKAVAGVVGTALLGGVVAVGVGVYRGVDETYDNHPEGHVLRDHKLPLIGHSITGTFGAIGDGLSYVPAIVHGGIDAFDSLIDHAESTEGSSIQAPTLHQKPSAIPHDAYGRGSIKNSSPTSSFRQTQPDVRSIPQSKSIHCFTNGSCIDKNGNLVAAP